MCGRGEPNFGRQAKWRDSFHRGDDFDMIQADKGCGRTLWHEELFTVFGANANHELIGRRRQTYGDVHGNGFSTGIAGIEAGVGRQWGEVAPRPDFAFPVEQAQRGT